MRALMSLYWQSRWEMINLHVGELYQAKQFFCFLNYGLMQTWSVVLFWTVPNSATQTHKDMISKGDWTTISFLHDYINTGKWQWPHPARVLDNLDILLAKLVRIELEQPLGNLWQWCELWLLVNIFLPIFILKEALRKRMRKFRSWTHFITFWCNRSNLDLP